MPRRPRIKAPGIPLHIIQRGNNRQSSLISHHILYQNLGQTDEERQMAYRELFRYELEAEEIGEIRKATNGNVTLGSSRFSEEISQMLGRRVTPGKAGRPRNE